MLGNFFLPMSAVTENLLCILLCFLCLSMMLLSSSYGRARAWTLACASLCVLSYVTNNLGLWTMLFLQQLRLEKEALEEPYKWVLVDGRREKNGNFRVEPPGLFRGRGEHPKKGCLKRRIQPEDITINIGESAAIPQPPPGHKWKEVPDLFSPLGLLVLALLFSSGFVFLAFPL